MDEFEAFDVEPFAGRLSGMHDWTGITERIYEAFPVDLQPELGQEISEGKLTLHIMYLMYQNMLRMGPIEQMFSMVPGSNPQLISMECVNGSLAKIKNRVTIMESMTNEELNCSNPKLIDESRMMRIARGSGRSLEDVKVFLKQYEHLADWLKMKLPKIMKNGNMSTSSNIYVQVAGVVYKM